MKSFWIRVSPIPLTGVLTRRGHVEIHTQREKGLVKTKAETGVRYPKSRKAKDSTTSWKRQGRSLP